MILLSKKQIIKLHSELVKEFGGIDGIRDKGLIESSISNVYQSYFGVEKYPTIEEKAARLCYSFIKNHAFLDGNKRIGIYVMMVLLELNGISLNCSNDELTELGWLDSTRWVCGGQQAVVSSPRKTGVTSNWIDNTLTFEPRMALAA